MLGIRGVLGVRIRDILGLTEGKTQVIRGAVLLWNMLSFLKYELNVLGFRVYGFQLGLCRVSKRIVELSPFSGISG